MNNQMLDRLSSLRSAFAYIGSLVLLAVTIGLACTRQGTPLDPTGIVWPVEATGISPSSGPTSGGTKVTITGSHFRQNSAVLFGAFLGEQTQVINDQVITSVAPAQAAGKVDITIVTSNFDPSTLEDGFEYIVGLPVDDGKAPRVVGATSIDNNTVLVTFSKPMGVGANLPASYQITGTDTAFLIVTTAELLADMTSVKLTTLTQDFDLYTVHVVGVKDAFGRELATPDGIIGPPVGIDPTRAVFRGTAPTQAQIDFDTDGDGFGDWFEMKGWFVTVKFANGTESTFHVTSDPFAPDTDLDGLDDSVENQFSWDPRTNDTDADHITDSEEFNDWYTDPDNQDTDGDGLADPLEIQFFFTSPILADTDGDQWTDDDELFYRNRNPRRSDIPLPQIRVGTPAIFIKETYSFTDERGNTMTRDRQSTTSMSQSNSRTLSTSDTQSSENTDSYSQEIGTEFTIGGSDPFGGFSINAKVGFEQTRQRGYSSTVSNESATSSSQEYQNSISEGTSFSESRAFSRTIDEARLNLDVTISNLGDVAFTISDLELAAFVRDPIRKIDVPLATLLSERSIAGDDQQFNLGPFDLDRGPFIFRDIQIFPNVAEQLRAAPQALSVKIANFNIRDESGRLFAFSSQDINDRTAGIIIDYGNGEVEAHRVATAATFDEFGRSRGITMRTALVDILGIARVENESTAITNPNSPAVRNSYGTVVDSTGLEILTRVRGVQTTVGTSMRDRKFWVIISSTPLPTGVNFSDTVLKAGTNYSLQFVADRDSDGLFASTEFLDGCSDDSVDTDGDGIGDFDEVRTGWLLKIPGAERRVFSDPARADSDGDGKSDFVERQFSTDPRKADTDEDGINDREEIDGFELVLFDGDDDPTNNPVVMLTPYTDLAIIDGGNGTSETTASGDDVQVVTSGNAASAGAAVVAPGPNGRIDTTPAGDDFIDYGPTIIAGANLTANTTASGDDIQLVAPATTGLTATTRIIGSGLNGRIDTALSSDDLEQAGHEQLVATDPLRRDTDADSLFDGRERLLGSQPNNPKDAGTVVDTDFDGMVDAEETNGWDVMVNGMTVHVTSDPLKPDTDADGLPDLMERFFRLNPRARDTDGDTIADRTELDPLDPRSFFPAGTYDDFNLVCATALECHYTAPTTPVGTNPLLADTDGDMRNDNVERDVGWFVQVFGMAQYEVFSDPFKADADADGLNDSAELAAGTDPDNNNTDGDNRNDGYEVNTRLTNPLKPDMKVTFTYTSYTVNGDCDDAAFAGLELEGGPLRITKPDGTVVDLVTFSCPCGDDCSSNTDGTTVDFTDMGSNFLLETGQSFTASSGTLKDHDIELCSTHGLDDDIGSFSQAYTYPVAAGGQALLVGSGDCSITVNATISVD
ncbi:MAG: IPT/TIG domain-containing protein [Planctomycetes bacterium]|nr:IPT/TIG domain-containing protein [Planctomycetota bacterium]